MPSSMKRVVLVSATCAGLVIAFFAGRLSTLLGDDWSPPGVAPTEASGPAPSAVDGRNSLEISDPPTYLKSGYLFYLGRGLGPGRFEAGPDFKELLALTKDMKTPLPMAQLTSDKWRYSPSPFASYLQDYDGVTWSRVGTISYQRELPATSDSLIAEYRLNANDPGRMVAIWVVQNTRDAFNSFFQSYGIDASKLAMPTDAYLVKCRPWVSVQDWNDGRAPDQSLSRYFLWAPKSREVTP